MGTIIDTITGPLRALTGGVGGLLDSLVSSDADRLKAQAALLQWEAEIHKAILEADYKIAQEQATVLTAEISSQSRMGRNWRPTLMYVFIFIIFYNFVVAPMFGLSVEPLPDQLWVLLNLGIGGYVGGRTLEKLIPKTKFGKE